ncbi:MAG: mitochondrial fission ELM1 family protein [Luteimonas sp.]
MERPDRAAALHAHASSPACAVSDGRAGNLRQAEALAYALGGSQSILLAPRWPWRALAPRRFAGSTRGYGAALAHALERPPALAVGCGRQAALATRLLRERGARTVQILDPRIDPSHWDVVVVPRHDRLRGANVLVALGSLHPVDDLWLAQARARFDAFAQLPRPRTTVLLGGPSRHVRFDRDEFESLARQLDAAVARDGGSLLLTASRRTSAALREAVRQRYADTPAMAWLGPEDGENPYPGMLAWADRIVCSPDSVNMVSEACATPVPVHVFEPGLARGRVRDFLDVLSGIGRIRAVDAELASFDVQPLRETARIAAEIRERLTLR